MMAAAHAGGDIGFEAQRSGFGRPWWAVNAEAKFLIKICMNKS
jgi:hypothetical protein